MYDCVAGVESLNGPIFLDLNADILVAAITHVLFDEGPLEVAAVPIPAKRAVRECRRRDRTHRAGSRNRRLWSSELSWSNWRLF